MILYIIGAVIIQSLMELTATIISGMIALTSQKSMAALEMIPSTAMEVIQASMVESAMIQYPCLAVKIQLFMQA